MPVYLHRTPQLLDRRKPNQPHQFEVDPHGRLSNGLVSLLLFDGGQTLAGLRDYANPKRTFAATTGTVTMGTGPAGAQWTATNNSTLVTPTPIIPITNGITFSLYTKKVTPAVDFASFSVDSAVASAPMFYEKSSDTYKTDYDTTVAQSGIVPTYWHRILVACETVNHRCVMYIDGIRQFSVTQNQPIGTSQDRLFGDTFNNGWVFPTSDVFFWNRALSDQEIAEHFANPFTSVLRPRWSERLRKGGVSTPPARIFLGSFI